MEDKGTKAPRRPDYVNLSEYPPGTDIEYELTYDGHRFVGKVPKWAHEKWLLKHQNEGTEALKRAWKDSVEIPPETAAAYGGKRPCEDHPNSDSTTADAAASDTKALKHPWEDLVEDSSTTAAAYSENRSCSQDIWILDDDAAADDFEMMFNRSWIDSVVIPSETVAAYGRYAFMQEGRRIVYKLDKWNVLHVPRPTPLKEDPAADYAIKLHWRTYSRASPRAGPGHPPAELWSGASGGGAT